MITLRPADDRGSAHLNWLESRHSFSFGQYHDAEHMGFGPLRVINEDWIRPGAGFPTHGHRDMEIITYVIDGALSHKDSTDGGSTIRPGDVQRMSAGTGIQHSEFNASDTEPVHLLQIWIMPDEHGIEPSYEEKHFAFDTTRGALRLIAAKDGRDGSLPIHQDADLYAARLDAGARLTHTPAPGRNIWIQVVAGTLTVNGTEASTGDGLALGGETDVRLTAETDTEILLFDMTG
jgi:redox-sensitive bicupin YhaK (pirin superfamily)